jgi:gas vesicle protein
MTEQIVSLSKMAIMENTSKMLIALGAGLVAGGLLGVLFAPDKGTVTRHKIAEGGKKLADKIRQNVKEGKQKMAEQVNHVRDEEEVFA